VTFVSWKLSRLYNASLSGTISNEEQQHNGIIYNQSKLKLLPNNLTFFFRSEATVEPKKIEINTDDHLNESREISDKSETKSSGPRTTDDSK